MKEENRTKMTSYILLTCFKNEEENLKFLFHSILNQTILPKLWLLVDDGSDDNSFQIAYKFAKENDWINILTLDKSERDIGIHYAEICIRGFEELLSKAETQKINFGYIGLIDADMRPEKQYFEKLMREMNEDNLIGIASGGIYLEKSGHLILEKTFESLPRGGARLWRKECFQDTGGYTRTYSPDVVSVIHAINKGWKVRQFKNIVAIQSRPTSAAQGIIRGQIFRGKGDYYLGRKLTIAMSRGLYYSLRRPWLTGIAYLFGYFNAMSKKERINDDIVLRFYSKEKIWDSIFAGKTIFDKEVGGN